MKDLLNVFITPIDKESVIFMMNWYHYISTIWQNLQIPKTQLKLFLNENY